MDSSTDPRLFLCDESNQAARRQAPQELKPTMTSQQFTFCAANESETERLGQALAEVLPEGSVVALHGALGAGKTRLVQAIATALGVDRSEVVSPTFVLVHEYVGRHPIYHLDAYRIRDDDEFLQLGIHESFVPPNLVFIEWAERIEASLPEERFEVTIHILANDAREIEVSGLGTQCARAIDQLRARLN